MKIAVLTSSRADYGIYQPLLRRLEKDPFFELELIVFGTHLSRQHGYTVDLIRADGFNISAEIESLVQGDSEEAISTAMALTAMKFAGLWNEFKGLYDLVFCLGDRYEMFAGVSASIPFNIPIAHIHGGETTLGAIDDTLRHCLSQMCRYHFTTTEPYAERVRQLLGEAGQGLVFNVGSLSLDNMEDLELLDKQEFQKMFGINLTPPTILFTWHPETVNLKDNLEFLEQVLQSLYTLKDEYRIVITMPNADTMGNQVRMKLQNFIKENPKQVTAVETFGTRGYFSCMEHCSFVMGNSSSGIIEAASFGKYVLNIGDRQKGRAAGENVIHVRPDEKEILNAVKRIKDSDPPEMENLYWSGGAAEKIVEVLKQIFSF